ncbi:MAG: prolyl oligopeptidase family serine peptidase [Verrucomicrobiales bacterium]
MILPRFFLIGPLLICQVVAEPVLKYPATQRLDLIEKLHGVDVPDPYRWLEETDSAPARQWIEAQAELARGYLSKLPGRPALRKRIEELWNYDKHGLPDKIKGRLFYSKRQGLQNQSVYYWRDTAPNAPEHMLIDANTLSPDGTIAVSGASPSHHGRYFAYALSRSGSDWEEWFVIDVEQGRKTTDELKWVKFSSADWAADDSGFYYSRYDEPAKGAELKATNLNQKVFFHRVSTNQSEDKLVYAKPDQPQWMFGAGETEDGSYLIIDVHHGAAAKNAYFYKSLKSPEAKVVELLNKFDAHYEFVGHERDRFFFLTDKDAPRGRLVAIDLARPGPESWQTLISESNSVLQSVSHLGGRFIAQMLVDAHDEVQVFDGSGKQMSRITLPNLGAVSGFGGRQSDSETFYIVTGYAIPQRIYHYDAATAKSTPWWEPKVSFNPEDYVTDQLFYKSKDGSRVPIFVSNKKGLVRNGENPAILYGYGGFNIALGPSFSPSTIAWLERGGVYAVANLRGGGEYGEEWHKAGQRLNKQNVFDDFIAAAEFLIAEKITSSQRLAISGGSNGGLLVAASLLQRPELFAAAAPSVGVHDLLRFHKWTIGWAWQDEFGFPEREPQDFRNLFKLSPYHNVKPGVKYPPTLIATADHDDRVFPAHSFKFGAALQAAQAGAAPIVLRIETKAGHGAGTPTSKIIDRSADELAFFAKALGLAL